MNCPGWEERIALYAEGDQPSQETERHLAACPDCRDFAEGLKQSLATLRAAHEQPIGAAHFAALRARVLAQIDRPHRPLWRLAWIGGLAALVAVLVFLFWPQPVEPIRVAVARPPAPSPSPATLPVPPNPPLKRVARRKPAPKVRPPAEPLLVKLITDDPDVVIYWIAN